MWKLLGNEFFSYYVSYRCVLIFYLFVDIIEQIAVKSSKMMNLHVRLGNFYVELPKATCGGDNIFD